MPDVPAVETFPGQGAGSVVGSVVAAVVDVAVRRTLRRQSSVVFGHQLLAGRLPGVPWQQGRSEHEFQEVVDGLTKEVAAVRLDAGGIAPTSSGIVVGGANAGVTLESRSLRFCL